MRLIDVVEAGGVQPVEDVVANRLVRDPEQGPDQRSGGLSPRFSKVT